MGPRILFLLMIFIIFFVPRAFDESKPLSTAETRLIYSDVAERGTNYTFWSLWKSVFKSWLHWIGFCSAGCCCFNFLIFPRLTFCSTEPHYFLVLFLTFYSIQFVRGGLINSRFLILFFAISIACLAWRFLSYNCAVSKINDSGLSPVPKNVSFSDCVAGRCV